MERRCAYHRRGHRAHTQADPPRRTAHSIRAILFGRTHLFVVFRGSDSWVILSEIEQSIKNKIEAIGTPLKYWDIQINYGIKTGFNDAFIISTEKRNEILANCKTEMERLRTADLIRPILRGRDIKRYGYDWANLWLIYVPWHFPLHKDPTIQGASSKAEQAFSEQYPAVYQHLLQYKQQLSARNKAETGIRYEWYAIQRWGANYSDDFFKPKIMYAEIVQEPRFYLDNDGYFFPEATTFILTGEHLPYLYNLFHSKAISYFFKTFYAGGGLGDSGYRYKKTFFEKLPIPKFEGTELQQNIYNANMYSKIDQLYNLTKQEIREIESV